MVRLHIIAPFIGLFMKKNRNPDIDELADLYFKRQPSWLLAKRTSNLMVGELYLVTTQVLARPDAI